MSGKKKSGPVKNWKLAGEPVFISALPPEEERVLKSVAALFTPLSPRNSFIRTGESMTRAIEPMLRQHFPQYPAKDIAEALSIAVLIPVRFDEGVIDEDHLLLGAAIWLLDYLQAYVEEDFYSLLPVEPDDELAVTLPIIDDLSHTRGSVLRVMTVLRHRNDSCSKEYRRLLSVIRKPDAEKLRGAFLEKLLDYFGRYMEVRVRVKTSSEAKPSSTGALHSVLAKPMPADLDIYGTQTTMPLPSLAPDSPFMHSFDEKWPEIEFLMETPRLLGTTPDCMRKTFRSKRMIDLLSGFHVANPYELCTAYLLLEKENDVLVNLNTLTVAIKIAALQHLPWGYGEPKQWAYLCEEGESDYTLRYPYHPVAEDDEDAETLPISFANLSSQLSEAQLFYLATCIPLPRGKVPSRRLTQWFVEQGIDEIRAREFSFAAMVLSCQDDLHWEEQYEPHEYSDAEDAGQDVPEDAEAGSPAIDASQLAEQARQLKELRRALHDAERNMRALQEKLRESEKRSAQDRDELHQLRDALFRIKADEAPEDDFSGTSISLPFRVERRVLIFGGHDTWLKAIRPMLPGARFFEKESLPDLNAIRNADSLWIQTNAMSHEFYYRVLGVARKHEIPVRYFAFASARKCAIQVAEDESSGFEV